MNIYDDGAEILEGFISSSVVFEILKEVSNIPEGCSKGGIRNAEQKFASIKALVTSNKLINKAKDILGKSPKVVRVIFFDKSTIPYSLLTRKITEVVSRIFGIRRSGICANLMLYQRRSCGYVYTPRTPSKEM